MSLPMPIPSRITPPGPDDYDNHSNNDGDYGSSNSTHIPRPPSSVGASDSDDPTRQAALEADDDLDFSMDPCPPPTAVVVEGHVATASYLESNSSRGFTVDEDETVFPKAAVVVPPPSPKEQSRIVDKMVANKELFIPKPGQTRFAISNSWMERWQEYVNQDEHGKTCLLSHSDVDPPGPITNEDILEADGVTLKMYYSFRYKFVSKDVWDVLYGWYGGVPVERPMVRDFGVWEVEQFPFKVKLSRVGRSGMEAEIAISKACTLGDLKARGVAALQMGSLEECAGLRLHVIEGLSGIRELGSKHDGDRLDDIFCSREAAVEFELPGDGYYEDDFSKSLTSSSWRSFASRISGTPGLVGLHNLGNTCFMNAAIQCLSHIPEVVEYFVQKDGHRRPFLQDLNIDNPLGTRGELAKAFGDLVSSMWEAKEGSINPTAFRRVVCDHAQQFMGYDQHDSQEFLAYLLDGIHEDVNRVREKPFVEKVEARSGECDETAARRAWEAHLQRNDSFVVDTMQGQYKSVVTCPVAGCGKSSTTFDPAMYLSVPLPSQEEKINVEVVLVTLDGCRPKRYGVLVSKGAKLNELRRALSKASGVREDRMTFTDVWQHTFCSEIEEDHLVSSIRLDELVVFELPTWPKPPPVPSAAREINKGLSNGDISSSSSGSSSNSRNFGDNEGRFGNREMNGRGGGGRLWEEKLSPFVMHSDRQRVLRGARDPIGRAHLLLRAEAYLKRFPSSEEIINLMQHLEESTPEGGSDGEETSSESTLAFDLQGQLKEASNFTCSFMELDTLADLEEFRDAVEYLRALVEHEQPEVKVQIIQHRSRDSETYGRYRSSLRSTTTAFSFPAILSYLPHLTTVREFRERLFVLFRRFVRPRDPNAKRGEDDGVESELYRVGDGVSEVPDVEKEEEDEPGRGDPENVARLFRSGQLGLYTASSSYYDQERKILDECSDRDDDLISNWIDGTSSLPPKLALKWSDDAVQEAYDNAEVQQVEDDPSIEACRVGVRKSATLSMSVCLEHFLEREQLDETDMWYCSNCKEHRRAYKEMSLWRLPPVLVLHLKRFSYTYGGWASSGEKIDSFVTFPVKGLDMRHLEHASRARCLEGKCRNGARGRVSKASGSAVSCVLEDCVMEDWVVVDPKHQQQHAPLDGTKLPSYPPKVAKDGTRRVTEGHDTEISGDKPGEVGEAMYDLWGVVNHHGMLNGGHYTALVLNERDSRWYDFSDDHVMAVGREEDLVTADAYVLFYRRRQ